MADTHSIELSRAIIYATQANLATLRALHILASKLPGEVPELKAALSDLESIVEKQMELIQKVSP